MNLNDIASVEVLLNASSAAIYGARAFGGVLIITTKRGDDDISNGPTPGIVNFSPKGYYKARTFYSPQYDIPKTNARFSDQRTTLYWDPEIITDKDGKASFEYFNADGKGTYRIVVEGIDSYGNLGGYVYNYKVE